MKFNKYNQKKQILIGLYASQDLFAQEKGTETLEDLFEQKEIDICDIEPKVHIVVTFFNLDWLYAFQGSLFSKNFWIAGTDGF